MTTTTKKTSTKRRTQSERSHETKRKIIQSALHLLQTVGYQKTNLQDIARGANVTLGAVQHQFGNRQSLMEEVVEAVMAPLATIGKGWSVDALQLPLSQRAHEFVYQAWKDVYGAPSYIAAWSMFFGSQNTALFEKINVHRSVHDPIYFAHFVEVFPEVAACHAQPEQFAYVIFSALRGIAIMRVFDIDEIATQTQLDVITQMIIQAGSLTKKDATAS
ncbi:TetR/AcrR family transcriptional regulator [Paenalcaligenes hominis]|uniref:TetR/AcrR family transcriptional regulator n=1 Tax=Paenalcaligenes hominis TaxID=643674 RepID=UPI00352417B3